MAGDRENRTRRPAARRTWSRLGPSAERHPTHPPVDPQDTASAGAPAEPTGSVAGSVLPAVVAEGRLPNAEPYAGPPSDVQEYLYEIQRNLHRLLRDVDQYRASADSRQRAAEALNLIASQLHLGTAPPPAAPQRHGRRPWWSGDQWARYVSRLSMGLRADEVDDFGLDRAFEAHVIPILNLLFDSYFRVRTHGMQHIPIEGRVLMVCNRGGALPLDGLMLKVAVARQQPPSRQLRWLLEDSTFHAPFVGTLLNRVGAVRACPENATRLLRREAVVGVFPEGENGTRKLYKQRYQLQRFGRGGAIKVALRTQAPVIPVAVIGAEDAYPMLYRIGGVSRALGVPFLPITPTFPWLGPAGLWPLPSRFVVLVGAPLAALEAYGPDAADDVAIVNELNERLRTTVQGLVDEARRLRGDRVFL